MKELSQILTDATRSIKFGYFNLRIDGGDFIYRERVYCYELYHQMRLLWPIETPYYLNGEIDKAAHPILKQMGIKPSKPDFLVHQPGFMSGNHAIIEVKPAPARARDIKKDLRTLSTFVNEVKYQRAIYLFYGDKANSGLVERVLKFASDIECLVPIEIWLHREDGLPAKHNVTLLKQ